MAPPLGVIEGYYGRPWSWEAREDVVRRLAPHGYRTFYYAPKAEARLRRRWREPFTAQTRDALGRFAAACAQADVELGVGLSPFEIWRGFDDDARAALADRLAEFEGLGVRRLAILFDDMRGDTADLALAQARIVDWIAARTPAPLAVCPTYYNDDPGLDLFFGARPAGYLQDLGAALDPSIDLFWTGPETCSLEIGVGHLERVAEAMRRPPLLWDNYPVNDGPRMSPHLHLRAFTGRPASIGPLVRGHMINPALQPTLSCIPAITLAQSYQDGDAYDYGRAFRRAADEVLGLDFAAQVEARLTALQDVGLDRLGEDATRRLRRRFSAIHHPAAGEIVDWLEGVWTTSREDVETA
ncbi:MAG TPA: beta-N-acetylglucosaminidase domain-containing protein [Caulobacteraceae bacterium]|jgi:hypothetical protein|nr:beta-N-acetylglucosaminidase domain-containing protein [Caulobacteraceae bacterium]